MVIGSKANKNYFCTKIVLTMLYILIVILPTINTTTGNFCAFRFEMSCSYGNAIA